MHDIIHWISLILKLIGAALTRLRPRRNDISLILVGVRVSISLSHFSFPASGIDPPRIPSYEYSLSSGLYSALQIYLELYFQKWAFWLNEIMVSIHTEIWRLFVRAGTSFPKLLNFRLIFRSASNKFRVISILVSFSFHVSHFQIFPTTFIRYNSFYHSFTIYGLENGM